MRGASVFASLPKCNSGAMGLSGKVRSLDTFRPGISVAFLIREFGVNEFTIRSIHRNEDIRSFVRETSPESAKITSVVREEATEKHLSLWINEMAFFFNMDFSDVCILCETKLDVNPENSKKSPGTSILLCSKVSLPTTDADHSEGKSHRASEEKRTVTDLTLCKECGGNVKSMLPTFRCSGCKRVLYVVCGCYESKEESETVPQEVLRKWKCRSCFQDSKELKIDWKCPKCFSKDSFCRSCKKLAENLAQMLRCAKCEHLHHYICQKLEKKKILAMTAEQKTKWICRSCTFEKFKEVGKKVGIHIGIAAGLTAACLVGIPLVVGALGFGSAGVAAGSVAAAYQSAVLGGNIAAGSAFAVLQSVGAAGLAGSTQAGIAAICSALPLIRNIKQKSSDKSSDAKNDFFQKIANRMSFDKKD